MLSFDYILIHSGLMLVLTGCGQEEQPEESSELLEYYENSLVFRLPAEHYPFTLMGVSDTHFYYCHTEITGDEEKYGENISFLQAGVKEG